MDVLVLGGTSFVGRAIVDELLARGHAPTIFSRGQTNPSVFPDVPRRQGDRTAGDYASLDGGRWEAVVDVSAYYPRQVDEAMTAVGDVGRYLLISTVSVYDVTKTGDTIDESSPRLAEVRDTETVTGETYGGLKVACEDDVLARLGDRATIVRPGVVAGPHDPTDRFTYWARRAGEGGRAAVPGSLEQPVQVVDSRDLARLCVQLLEDDRSGVYNGTGPALDVTIADLVRACAAAAGTQVEVVQVDPVAACPLVVPDPASWPMFRATSVPGRAAGLTATPLEVTARDTAAWDRERGLPPMPHPFTAELEAEALSQ